MLLSCEKYIISSDDCDGLCVVLRCCYYMCAMWQRFFHPGIFRSASAELNILSTRVRKLNSKVNFSLLFFFCLLLPGLSPSRSRADGVWGALRWVGSSKTEEEKSFQLQYIVVGERCVRVVRVGEKLKKHFQFQFAALSVLFISHSNSSSTKLSFEFKRRILTPTLSHMCVLLCIQNCEWVLNLKKNSKFLG